MRKRIAAIAALGGAVAIVLGLPTVASTAPPDVRGPKCADIMLVSFSYTGTLGGSATVQGVLTTPQAPSCQGAVYTVYVDGQSQAFTGDGSWDSQVFTFTVENAPSTICLYATSQLNVNAVAADTAPDTACSDPNTHLVLNGGGGASGFG
jgi:hypothetical protein